MEKILGQFRGNNRTMPFDLYAYRNPETEHWNIPDKYKPFIEEIFCVEVFDRNTGFHLCEATPSYEFEKVEYGVWCKDNAPDGLRDEIHEWVIGNADYSEPIHYHHVADIERLMQTQPERFHHIGDPNQPGLLGHGETFEWQYAYAIERLQGNPPF